MRLLLEELAIRTWSAVSSEAPHSQFGEGVRLFVHGQMESLNTSPQAIEINPSYSGQAHPNRPGTGLGPWV